MNRVLATNLYKALKEVKQTQISETLPVLNHAYLKFADGELMLATTDLKDHKVSHCPSIMNDEWSTCVLMVHKVETSHDAEGKPLKGRFDTRSYKYYPFLDFVKLHAEYEDVLALDFNPQTQILTIKVERERCTAEFKCMSSEEFPIHLLEATKGS